MSDNLKDILTNLNKEIEQDKLLDYLSKNLPDAEAHDIEKQMADDPFMNDAIEGLNEFKDIKNVGIHVNQLNHELKKQLDKKKKRKVRRLKDQPWVYFAIILLLLLIIISYVLIKKHLDKQKGLEVKQTAAVLAAHNKTATVGITAAV